MLFPAAMQLLIGLNENLGLEFLDRLVEGDKMHLKAEKPKAGRMNLEAPSSPHRPDRCR